MERLYYYYLSVEFLNSLVIKDLKKINWRHCTGSDLVFKDKNYIHFLKRDFTSTSRDKAIKFFNNCIDVVKDKCPFNWTIIIKLYRVPKNDLLLKATEVKIRERHYFKYYNGEILKIGDIL